MTLCSLRMGLRFLRARHGRMALTVIALACGVTQICANDLVSRAVLAGFGDVIETMAGRATLQITSGDGFFLQGVASQVAGVPGVAHAAPVVTATAFIRGQEGEHLTVHGFDLADEASAAMYEAYDGSQLFPKDPRVFRPRSAMLTRVYAERHGLAVGSTIALETTSGVHDVTIPALLEPKGIARVLDGNLVVMNLRAAQAIFVRPGHINRVDVALSPGADVEAVTAALRSRIPSGLRIETPDQRRTDLQRAIQSLLVVLQALGLLGLGAGFLVAYNQLTTAFEERLWQLGVMRAAGVRATTVWTTLMAESVVLGALGVVVGIPCGIALAHVVLPVIATTASINFNIIMPPSELRIRLGSILLAAAFGLGTATLAAIAPAWRASRTQAAAVMRARGIESPGAQPAARMAMRSALALATAAALVVHLRTQRPFFGLVATVLVAVVGAVLARPFVVAVARMLAAVSVFGARGRIVASWLALNPRRTAMSVALLGVGLGTVVWLSMLARSLEQSVIDALAPAMQSDLVVASSQSASGFLEAPVEDTLVTDLQSMPGVAEAVGIRTVAWHYAGKPIAVDAFDPSYFRSGSMGRWPVEGADPAAAWQAVADGDAALISRNFAVNFRLRVGDVLDLDTPSGPTRLRIAGVTRHFASPLGTVIVSRELYARLWNDPLVTRAFVRITPGMDEAVVRKAIGERLGAARPLRIVSSEALVDYFATQVRRAFAGVHVLAALVLAIVLVAIGDTLTAGVVERGWQLGLFRAAGIRRRDVQGMILMEAACVGTMGFVLATLLGLTLGQLWVRATFPQLFGWTLDLHIPGRYLGALGVLTLGVCIVAAWPPAVRAARLTPAAALRDD